MDIDSDNDRPELRPLIARLREIEKKCASMGSRNEEFPLIEERLRSIIKRLEAGEESSGEPLAYRAMASELFPVAHLFESVGFMSVGKEIAHVEKALKELAPEEPASDAPTVPESARRTAAKPATAADRGATAEGTDDDGPDHHVPRPVAAGLVVLLVAIAVATMIVLEVGPFRPKLPVRPAAPTAPVETRLTSPPLPTLVHKPTRPMPGPSNTLADEVAAARLALLHGDHEAAIDHLSAAALINRNHTGVLEIANELVGRLVGDADAAAANGRWEDAERILERARRVAMRFGIETATIDRTAQRHAAMERFVLVAPDDTRAIRSSTGRRVELSMKDGSVRTGRIEGVTGPDLLLDVDTDVGGGIVSFTDDVPLSSIITIKIFED
jgi:hypothetical protein